MKESRFIELLNLYVDQQLSAAEAAELETEIVRNVDRKTTYQQYCRMQKACTLLFEQECTQAPASATLAASLREANRKIVAFPDSRERAPRGYYPIGLLAAAACVTFVFVRFNAPSVPLAPSPQAAVVASAATPVREAPEVAQPVIIPAMATVASAPASDTARASYYSVFATQRAPQETRDDVSTELASDASVTPVVSYAWMQDVELEPVQSLSSNRVTLHTSSPNSGDGRVLLSRKPVRGVMESNAFTFQR